VSLAIIAPAYGEPDLLEFVGRPVPAPGDGEVTIEVRASGVNPADLKRLRGQFGANPAALPLRLGSEVSGVVTAVGPNAVGPAGPIEVGDEVIGYRVAGGFAQALTVPASSVLPKPATLDWAQAAGLMVVGVTAVHLLEATAVGAGDRVIVHGASGGVGSMAVQLAILRGAEVVGTAGPHSLDRVRAQGGRAVEYGDGLVERLRAMLPDGADAALDTVGTEEAVDASLALVPDRGRIASIAAFEYGGRHGIRLLGSGPGADPGGAIRDAARPGLIELAGAARLHVNVGRTFPLASAAEALEFLAHGHPGGKVVLTA
jgi:NADPH2:quinone reductase